MCPWVGGESTPSSAVKGTDHHEIPRAFHRGGALKACTERGFHLHVPHRSDELEGWKSNHWLPGVSNDGVGKAVARGGGWSLHGNVYLVMVSRDLHVT